MVFVIYKYVILSIEYCTQHSVLLYFILLQEGGVIPEGVIPGVLFMILPGRKPVSAIPGMMLFVRTWLCKI